MIQRVINELYQYSINHIGGKNDEAFLNTNEETGESNT
jgi:hypothetical protein